MTVNEPEALKTGKKRIAIVTGGDSSELVISLKSAEQVRLNLDEGKYEPFIVYIRENDWHIVAGSDAEEKIPVNRDNFSFEKDGQTRHFDYAFIALHGPPGEDGQLQAYLDDLGIPYSSSGARSLELSFDKFATKEIIRKAGILTADAVLIRKDGDGDGESDGDRDGNGGGGTDPGRQASGASAEWKIIAGDRASDYEPGLVIDSVGLPCFIKPNAGGSSFGVSRINRAGQLEAAIQKALKEDDEVLVETCLAGRELTCGLLKTGSREFIFPVTEIISKNEFFDYEAKYTAGMAEEVTPAEIPDELAEKCREVSSRIYDLLDCRGLVRIDFINHEEDLYFLELNGVPGMSLESIIPRMIRTMGYTEAEIYNLIIEDTAGW